MSLFSKKLMYSNYFSIVSNNCKIGSL